MQVESVILKHNNKHGNFVSPSFNYMHSKLISLYKNVILYFEYFRIFIFEY